MTAVSISSLPFALQVQAIITSSQINDGVAIAEKVVNPICLKGFLPQVAEEVRHNCLRQLRLEAHSSVLLRQLAKSIGAPVLVADPLNMQGGFITADMAPSAHPQIDLQPNAVIDFILDGEAHYQAYTLNRGDALIRRIGTAFTQLQCERAVIFRVVYYHAVAMPSV